MQTESVTPILTDNLTIHDWINICRKPEDESINIIAANIDKLTDQQCWINLCDNYNKKVMKIITANVDKLTRTCWVILCRKEYTTDFLQENIDKFITENECFDNMCMTYNNLCIVEEYTEKLTKRGWLILFGNQNAMHLIRPKMTEIKYLLNQLWHNNNRQASELVEEVIDTIKHTIKHL